MSKQYGLIIPPNNKTHKIQNVVARPSVFDDNSDSDDAAAAKPTGLKKREKKHDILNQEKAIEEDPTVYQYDEIYDEMDQKRKESKLSRKDLDKKPKYISRLLAAADRRKRENERRIEREVQKEREEEGEQFKDKDSFVTSSYRKKLEEMKELEEQEKREEYLESIGDVKKQGNLDGFYRHLYDQKVNFEDKREDSVTIKEEPEEVAEAPEPEPSKGKRKRKYRQRKESNISDDEQDDDEVVEVKKEHLPSNLDADSDFSIDSSDSEDEKTKRKKDASSNEDADQAIKEEAKPEEAKPNEDEKKAAEIVEEPKPKKPKIDIWKKRTVGTVFDEAVKRYFERKAIRESTRGN